jgi:cob(I)alamin adenosyltransferase
MSFYTRKGDDGYTGLLGEGRLPKYHPRPEAVGAVDEATSALGMARASCRAPQIAPVIIEIQRDLYLLMAELAATPEEAEKFRAIQDERVSWLEGQIDALSRSVSLPKEFILPGDTAGGAALDLARTAVRRAERRVAELHHLKEITNPSLLTYLNRLSSLCFVLELLENQHAGHPTTLPEVTRMTGTLINIVAVLVGGSLGLLFGARLPDRLKSTVISGMGLFTAALGVQMFLKTGNPLVVLGSVIIGVLLGEWWRIEDRLQAIGDYLEGRFAGGVRPPAPGDSAPDSAISSPAPLAGETEGTNSPSRFVRGFLIATLLFCVGPMNILGSIHDGLTGDYSLLAVKSVDGFAA